MATAAYWTHLLGLRVVMRRLATEAGDGPGVPAVETGSSGWAEPAGRAATYATWAAMAFFVLWGFARWQAVDHAPWSNMYEFTTAFAGTIAAFYAIFERGYGHGDRTRSARSLGALALPVVLAMLLVAAALLPLGYPAARAGAPERGPAGDPRGDDDPGVRSAQRVVRGGGDVPRAGREAQRFARLPKARTLDDIAYRSVMVGFPLLAGGIALGAYWADHAWGRYWGWDPKETSALVTWLVYGVYLHMRTLRGWSGTRSAWVLVVAFGAVMFTYFVVNLWVSGLHSYAGV